MNGKVWLVGAGPGDPDLLTLRAVRALGAADLILHDALVDRRVFELAPRATRFYVGKRAGRHSMSQRTIERLLVRAARQGKNVVRLKCGDPFVLGRGGEEALALREAGIEVEIVPGITSAVAAPAAAGIPVTHRGIAAGFLVLSGAPQATWRRVLSGLPPRSVTVVMLMALGCRREVAAHLLAHGWAGDTPAAIVRGAHTPDEHVTITRLEALGDAPETDDAPDGDGAPGVLVIGDVVDVARRILPHAAEGAPTAPLHEVHDEPHFA